MNFNNNQIYTLFILIVLFYSCNQNEEVKLNISDDRLVELITDMHFLEAIVQKTDKTQKDSVRKVYKEQITKIYNLKSVEGLDSLLTKAQSFPEYFKVIQDKSSTLLDSLEKNLNKNVNLEKSK